MSNEQYEIEAQALSAEALAEQEKRFAAIKAEASWRKRHQAKIDAGIVALAEAKDPSTKQWIEGLRREVIGKLRKAESAKDRPAESAPRQAAEQVDSKPDQRPVQAAPQPPHGGQPGTAQAAGNMQQNTAGRP